MSLTEPGDPVRIHRVTLATASCLAGPAPEVFDHPPDFRRVEAYLADPGRALFVAIAEGHVVGQLRALLVHHPDQPPECLIENLGVTPAWQRQGIATRLVAAALRLAEDDWGCGGFYVLTEADNDAARAFYAAQGWGESRVAMFDGRVRAARRR